MLAMCCSYSFSFFLFFYNCVISVGQIEPSNYCKRETKKFLCDSDLRLWGARDSRGEVVYHFAIAQYYGIYNRETHLSYKW